MACCTARMTRLSSDPFHLSGSLGNRLIGVRLPEESELKARGVGISSKDEWSHGDWRLSPILQSSVRSKLKHLQGLNETCSILGVWADAAFYLEL
jgi:hypothetical protein